MSRGCNCIDVSSSRWLTFGGSERPLSTRMTAEGECRGSVCQTPKIPAPASYPSSRSRSRFFCDAHRSSTMQRRCHRISFLYAVSGNTHRRLCLAQQASSAAFVSPRLVLNANSGPERTPRNASKIWGASSLSATHPWTNEHGNLKFIVPGQVSAE
jgi:hypothetical protein